MTAISARARRRVACVAVVTHLRSSPPPEVLSPAEARVRMDELRARRERAPAFTWRRAALALGGVAAFAQCAAIGCLILMFSVSISEGDPYRAALGFLPYTSMGAGLLGVVASLVAMRLPEEGSSSGVGLSLLFSTFGLALGGVETLLFFFVKSLGRVAGPF